MGDQCAGYEEWRDMKNSPLPKGATNLTGKGSKCEDLPSRFAMETLTSGATSARFRNDYGKVAHKDEMTLNQAGIGTLVLPLWR